MPTPDKHRLTEQEQKKAINWLHTRAKGGGRCLLCDNNTWSIIDAFTAVVVYSETALILEQTVPLVGFVCNHCANVQFFSAVAMGLLPSEEGGGNG